MRVWTSKVILPSVLQAVRTAVAATVSVLVAWLVRMPEPYWSAIATLIMMQSTLRATLTLSLGRIVASALGASVGAIEATYFGQNLVAFGLTVFLLGLMSFASRLDKPGYRYASVTLAIVVLIPRVEPPWLIAVDRLIEVSLGILVALAVAAIWREEDSITIS